MKPSGSASAKKRRSAAVSASPEQPKIAAPGAGAAARLPLRPASGGDDDAADISSLQLAAQHVRQRLLAQRSGLDTVIDAPRPQIDALIGRLEAANQTLVRLPRPVPGGACLLFRSQRRDLHPPVPA